MGNFTCPACKQSFLSEMMLKYHDCPEKKEEEDQFKCDTCGKTYWSEKMLKIHEKTHIKFDDDIDDAILNMEIKMPVAKKQVVVQEDDDDLVL